MQNDERTQLGETGPIDLPPVDVTPFIGARAKIAIVDECKNKGGNPYVQLETMVVGQSAGLDIKARKRFWLKTDAKGKTGWPIGGPFAVFLAGMGVNHYRELVGREVICQTEQNKKDGKFYLSFIPAPRQLGINDLAVSV